VNYRYDDIFVTSSDKREFCTKQVYDLCNYELVTFIVLCAQVGRCKWKLVTINYCHNFLFLYSKRERYSLTKRVEFGLFGIVLHLNLCFMSLPKEIVR